VIKALPTFRIVASMNPFDNVGTTRISPSVHDRLCRLSVSYQDESSEQAIVRLRADLDDGPMAVSLVTDAVAVTRATRGHPDIRQGSSVRGAIDIAALGAELASQRQITSPEDDRYPGLLLDAMFVALSGRIQLDEMAETTPEQVLRDIWEQLLLSRGAAAAPG
jgi:MoxR-like ATPase